MATKVGTKGQVVIDQPIREQLGIQPGMIAVQEVVDGAVVIHFLPGTHTRSLAGALRPYVRRWPSEAERERLEDEAWADEVAERWRATEGPAAQ